MRSTGEVMGIDADFHAAFYKAQIAADNALPTSGCAFVSVKDQDKPAVVEVAKLIREAGLSIVATHGTQAYLSAAGIECEPVNKVKEGRPHIVDRIINGDVQMVVNTTIGKQSILDSASIRQETVRGGIPYFTTIAAARVAARSMAHQATGQTLAVRSLQHYHLETAQTAVDDSGRSESP
jgi:carbamoyl-phosphate synthase large subunit